MTRSTSADSPLRHPNDGVLLALHDGESGETLDADRAHVEHCAACQARLSVIANHAAAVRRSLSSIIAPPLDADAVRRRLASRRATPVVPLWRRPAAVAAAVLIVVASVAAAASPLRHWLVAHTSPPKRTIVAPSSNAPAESPRTPSGSTVSFAASGPEFTVRLDSLPTAGILTIEHTTADEISAQVITGAGTGGDAMVVLPGELLFRNTSSSRASYKLTLPREVVRLRVIVAGRLVLDGSPPGQVKLTVSR